MSLKEHPRCSFVPCGRPNQARGLCAVHYQQERRGEELHQIRAAAWELRALDDPTTNKMEISMGMREDFPTLLRSFRERAGRSRNSLANEVGVDPSYLTRIEHGDREPPRQHIVEALARVLRLSLSERNRLLVGAGFAPLSVMQLGSWDDALQAVADVLNDATLSAEERDQFRSVVQMISARWRGQSEAVARPA
jgi:transcriptional regulator with XRE-family HTH domain